MKHLLRKLESPSLLAEQRTYTDRRMVTAAHNRELARMEHAGEAIEYTYNRDGLRVRKESGNSGTTDYILSGKNIVHMTREKNGVRGAEMHYYYHEMDKPATCLYNGKRYGYLYNVQGDVAALIDLENARHQAVTYAMIYFENPNCFTLPTMNLYDLIEHDVFWYSK